MVRRGEDDNDDEDDGEDDGDDGEEDGDDSHNGEDDGVMSSSFSFSACPCKPPLEQSTRSGQQWASSLPCTVAPTSSSHLKACCPLGSWVCARLPPFCHFFLGEDVSSSNKPSLVA